MIQWIWGEAQGTSSLTTSPMIQMQVALNYTLQKNAAVES